MLYLLNISYLLLIVACSPWLLWAAIRHGKYREGWSQKLLGKVPRRNGPGECIWFHAVSVGEVQMLQVLIDRILTRHPTCELVISSTTQSGYDLARQRYAGHTVCYCPLDFSWSVRVALQRIRPTLLVLVELEVWPNLIAQASRQRVPVAVVNGRLSVNSFRGYRRLRGLLSRTFGKLRLVAAQNREYAERFRRLGVAAASVQVSGSLKFDGLHTDRSNEATQSLVALAAISQDDVVFLAGSTQAPEEAVAIEAFRTLADKHPQLRLILVPRHPHRFAEVADLLDSSGLIWQRRTKLEGTPNRRSRVLLVDSVGELAAWWGVADIAFVGGSLGSRGGQNMMEPAGYGAAVSFGPNTKNFRDVVDLLLRNEAAVVIRDCDQLTQFVQRCLADAAWRGQLGGQARRLVMTQTGAADRTVELLLRLLPARSQDVAA